MPTTLEHANKAKSDLRAYAAIPDSHPDWKAVALFHAALHCVETLAVFLDEPNHEHKTRERFLMNRAKSIYKAYHRLRTESDKARYLKDGGFSMSAKTVQAELYPLVMTIQACVSDRMKPKKKTA